ncbi:hypothetical protein LLL8_22110 [Lactococcus lactis]|nr:hypothetical protein LLL8_22110 [Lactococcus lactis]
MSELEEFKKVVSPIAYGLAYKSKLGTTEYQQLYTEEDVAEYFNNKPSLTIPKRVADSVERHHTDGYGHEDFEELVRDWAYDLIYKYNEPFEKQFESLNDEEYHKAWSEIEIPSEINNSPDKRFNIIRAYLAGKALGVDLVKVI